MSVQEDTGRDTASDAGEVGLSAEVVSDQPILRPEQDRLGFAAYANALAEVIDTAGTVTPLTISIDAPWGAGKTSLARLVEHNLREWPKVRGDPPHIICWFNAWLHSDAPKLGPALAAGVGRTLARERPLPLRILNPLPSAMLSPSERWHRRLILGLLALVVTGLAFLAPTISHSLFHTTTNWGPLAKLTVGGTVLAAIPLAVTTWNRAFSIAQAAAAFVDDPKSQAATGAMSDVVTQFSKLVTSATRGRRRLVIFVDDLERCQPARAVEVCEIANLLLAQKDVVTVLIGDLSGLRKYAQERSAEVTSVESSSQGRGNDRAHNYLDKIVQLEFSLPPLDKTLSTQMLDDSTARPASSQAASPVSGGRRQRTRSDTSWLTRCLDLVAGTSKRYWLFLGVLAAIFVLAAVVLGALDPKFSSTNNSWGNTVFTWVFAVEFVLAVLIGLARIQRRRKTSALRQTTEDVDREIRATIGESGFAKVHSVDGLVTQFREATKADEAPPVSSRLVVQRARRALVEQLVGDASTEVRDFLPHLPRGIKRAANRLYLLVSVAVSRDMLGGAPELTARHVGKWSVLLDRWPQLAEAIMSEPSLAEHLENPAAGSTDPSLSQVIGPNEDLSRFWQGQTKIAPVVERLVSALPARPAVAAAVPPPVISLKDLQVTGTSVVVTSVSPPGTTTEAAPAEAAQP